MAKLRVLVGVVAMTTLLGGCGSDIKQGPLTVGDCYGSVKTVGGPSAHRKVSCSEPHFAEVIAVDPEIIYFDDNFVENMAASINSCRSALEDRLGVALDDSIFDTWMDDDDDDPTTVHPGVCSAILKSGEDFTGRVEDATN